MTTVVAALSSCHSSTGPASTGNATVNPISVGDSVKGSARILPATYKMKVDEGDTADVRFTEAPPPTSISLYPPLSYALTINDPVGNPLAALGGGSEYWRLPGTRTGAYTMTVQTCCGDARGGTVSGWDIATRAGGPILFKVAQPHPYVGWGSADATDRPSGMDHDTLWVWNGASGTGTWWYEPTNALVSIAPTSGTLPLVMSFEPPSLYGPPQGAQALLVTMDARDLTGYQKFDVDLGVVGSWGSDPAAEFIRYYYDAQMSPLPGYSMTSRANDVAVAPDGSIIVAPDQGGVVSVDPGTGSATEVFDSLQSVAAVTVDPDGTLYVLDGNGPDTLWRVPSGASRERVLVSDSTTGRMHYITADGKGGVLMSSDSGLAEVDSTGALSLLSKVDWGTIAFDPSTATVYGVNGSQTLYAIDLSDSAVSSVGTLPVDSGYYSSEFGSIAVGRSHTVYCLANELNSDPDRYFVAIFSFDPSSRTWGQQVFAPNPTAIAVAVGRLVLGPGYGPLWTFPVNDGPP